jgi:hypothetical protein
VHVFQPTAPFTNQDGRPTAQTKREREIMPHCSFSPKHARKPWLSLLSCLQLDIPPCCVLRSLGNQGHRIRERIVRFSFLDPRWSCLSLWTQDNDREQRDAPRFRDSPVSSTFPPQPENHYQTGALDQMHQACVGLRRPLSSHLQAARVRCIANPSCPSASSLYEADSNPSSFPQACLIALA